MSQESSVTWKRSRTSLVFFITILIFFLILNVGLISQYLLALFMGAILALLTYGVYRRLRSRGLGPKLSSAIVTIGVTVLVLGPLSSFIMAAIKQAIAVGQALAHNEALSFQAIFSRLSEWKLFRMLVSSPEALERQLRASMQGFAKTGSGLLLSFVGNIPDLLLQTALALLTCYFLLIDGKRFMAWIMERIPLDPDVQDLLMRTFQGTSASVIWATIAAASAQAAVLFVAYLVLSVPGAFLAGGATFILAWIPMIGSVPVWVVGAIYLYVQGELGKMVAMIAFGAIAGVVDNFVRPLVLRGRGELHPLVSLVAIFGGISWFGITGVFVGPILASVVISLLQIWPAVARRSHLTREVSVPPAKSA